MDMDMDMNFQGKENPVEADILPAYKRELIIYFYESRFCLFMSLTIFTKDSQA
jgi:hypothetical protein